MLETFEGRHCRFFFSILDNDSGSCCGPGNVGDGVLRQVTCIFILVLFTMSHEVYGEYKEESVDDDEQRTFESANNASTRWHLVRRSGSVQNLDSPLNDNPMTTFMTFALNPVIYTHASFPPS